MRRTRKVMLHPPEQPGATIELGAKDLSLFRAAAASGKTQSSLADTMAEIFAEAQRIGMGNEDWAVGQYKMAQRRGRFEPVLRCQTVRFFRHLHASCFSTQIGMGFWLG